MRLIPPLIPSLILPFKKGSLGWVGAPFKGSWREATEGLGAPFKGSWRETTEGLGAPFKGSWREATEGLGALFKGSSG